ncbi:MAG: PIN domain-containing protein [Ardenticatenaceae bacterium]|nr:PIN domain-containing protein [Ardenticatenaceae bacterium]
MKLDDALTSVSTLFLDTAPVIYYVEQNPAYFGMIYEIFERVDEGTITAVTSPITLSECLVFPYRHGNVQLQADFADLIIRGNHTQFVGIDEYIGEHAAELRARYNLALADALQFAVALAANCQAFLTNDKRLKRVSELRVLVVDELE